MVQYLLTRFCVLWGKTFRFRSGKNWRFWGRCNVWISWELNNSWKLARQKEQCMQKHIWKLQIALFVETLGIGERRIERLASGSIRKAFAVLGRCFIPSWQILKCQGFIWVLESSQSGEWICGYVFEGASGGGGREAGDSGGLGI